MRKIYSPADIEKTISVELGNGGDVATQARRNHFIENVGQVAAREIQTFCKDTKRRILVIAGEELCGGYALETASALYRMGESVGVILINIGGQLKNPITIAARKHFLQTAGAESLYELVDMNKPIPSFQKEMLIVDGIYGREYNHLSRGGFQIIARQINESKCKVVSLDVPSGMTSDLSIGMINRNIVHADLTLTFIGPTLSFYLPETQELLGRWKVMDVDIDQSLINNMPPIGGVVDRKVVASIIPARNRFAEKSDLGTALIFAGSYGMSGAALLSTRAACRSGCGKIICHGPRSAYYVIQSQAPSALFETTEGEDHYIHHFSTKYNYDAVAIGPGLGRAEETTNGLESFLKQCDNTTRLVLDADALNCIADCPRLLDYIPPRSILTPHKGEFDRLFGKHPLSSTRLLKAIEIAKARKITIVLKGHFTQIVWPDGKVFVNSSGTEALATAGSGDVLTGLIAGLLAQGIHPEYAALAGVYIHGVAGQMAAIDHGINGTTAEDIADYIGTAIDNILHPRAKQ